MSDDTEVDELYDSTDSEKNSIRNEYSLLVDHLNGKGYTQFNNPINDFEDVPLGPEDPRVLDEPPKPDAASNRLCAFTPWAEVVRISREKAL